MCGINGLISNKSRADLGQIVAKMNTALAHRGPNADGVWAEDGYALGHRRLSIIDLSESGNQPMLSADGRYVLVFNGEIYNFQTLKQNLTAYPFTSNTDSEVLLAGLIAEGEEFIKRLEGMFAFAFFDSQEQQMFIARDRLGIKPIYYYHSLSPNTLAFSSEIRSLVASGLFEAKISKQAIKDYLIYQSVHFPATILEGVSMLNPGHILSYKKGKVNIYPYWELPRAKSKLPLTSSDVKANVRKLTEAAVEKRLVSDVPFGAFLSGGIDSSLVVGLMSKISPGKVNTFNVNFDESEFSEAKYAQLVAKKFKTEHTEITLKPEDFLDSLPNALDDMDHPSGDGPNTWVVSREVKKAGVTMALSGLGGDELFAGYPIFNRLLKLKKPLYKTAFRLGSNSIGNKILPDHLARKMANLPKMSSLESSLYAVSRQVFTETEVTKILSSDGLREPSNYTLLKSLNWENDQYISTCSRLELTTYLHDTLLCDTDQMSMAHALEVRVPFLDHHLLEYVLSLPDSYKRSKTPKGLLVNSFADLLPSEIVNRKKMGFAFPWLIWLKGSLAPFVKQQFQHLEKHKVFNALELERIYQQFMDGKMDREWAKIWLLTVLGYWLNKNINATSQWPTPF